MMRETSTGTGNFKYDVSMSAIGTQTQKGLYHTSPALNQLEI